MKKLLTIAFLSFILCGCSTLKPVTLMTVVENVDIIKIPIGATVHIPAGSSIVYKDTKTQKVVNTVNWDKDTDIIVQKNGRFYSDELMNSLINIQ